MDKVYLNTWNSRSILPNPPEFTITTTIDNNNESLYQLLVNGLPITADIM